MAGTSPADVALAALGAGALGGVVGAVGLWLQQRTTSRQRADSATLAGSSAAAAMVTAGLGQWERLVASQGVILGEHVAEIRRLRERADACEGLASAQSDQIRRLQNELRMVRANVIEERRIDE